MLEECEPRRLFSYAAPLQPTSMSYTNNGTNDNCYAITVSSVGQNDPDLGYPTVISYEITYNGADAGGGWHPVSVNPTTHAASTTMPIAPLPSTASPSHYDVYAKASYPTNFDSALTAPMSATSLIGAFNSGSFVATNPTTSSVETGDIFSVDSLTINSDHKTEKATTGTVNAITTLLNDGATLGISEYAHSINDTHGATAFNNQLTTGIPYPGDYTIGSQKVETYNVDINGYVYSPEWSPTDVLHVKVAPPLNVSVSEDPEATDPVTGLHTNVVTWDANPLNGNFNTTGAGYDVYRNGDWIGQTNLATTTFTDSDALWGTNTYMVKAFFKSKYNTTHESVGASDSVDNPHSYGFIFNDPSQPDFSQGSSQLDFTIYKDGSGYTDGTATINWTQDGHWSLSDLNYTGISSGWTVDLGSYDGNIGLNAYDDQFPQGTLSTGLTLTATFYDNADLTSHTVIGSFHYAS